MNHKIILSAFLILIAAFAVSCGNKTPAAEVSTNSRIQLPASVQQSTEYADLDTEMETDTSADEKMQLETVKIGEESETVKLEETTVLPSEDKNQETPSPDRETQDVLTADKTNFNLNYAGDDNTEELEHTANNTADNTQNIETTTVDTSWKSAYIEFINNYVAEYDFLKDDADFFLIDINGDSIPEMHIQSNYGFRGSTTLTYNSKNNRVSSMEGGNGSGIYYLKGKNLFVCTGGHMDYFHDEVYKIEDGDFSIVAQGEYGAFSSEDSYDYYWNDVQVSEEEYHNSLNKALDPTQADTCCNNIITYSYDGIIDAINNA